MTSTNNQQAHKKETLLLSNAQSQCEEAAREFKDFQNNLNIIIVVADAQSAEAALLEKQSEILALPSGEKLHNLLKAHLTQNNINSQLIGITKHTQKKLMGLTSEEHFNVLIALNTSNHADSESLKGEIYALIWQALSVIDDVKRDVEECITSNDDIITAKWNDAQQASRNMLADIFSGSLLEVKGQRGALKTIAKIRSKACFENLRDYDAQSNPFPIMLETAQMVLDDLHKPDSNIHPIKQALSITSETIETMDENTIRQWQNFIEAAQEMAWGGLSISQILGAAIYTSDNVYNRTSAYMIADTLNTDPTPSLQFEGYNAFVDIDSQQRNHKIACLETLEHLEERQREERNAKAFFEIAMHSCQTLLEGKPNGFCAPALILVGQNIIKTPDITKEEVAGIFSNEINATTWSEIRNMHKEIIALKKQHKEISIKTIIEILRREEHTRESAILVKQLSDMNLE